MGGVVLCANAQRSDGFFKNNDDTYNNRGEISNNITLGGVTNNENPTEAPIGSGLLIMVAAGAGYAVARRKNAARKGMTMLVALGLMLGLTQCKKNTVTPVTPSTTENRINITLNANYGGEKTTFDPSGSFAWNTSGIEYINVGGKVSGYLGQLTNEGHEGTGSFSGSIKTPAVGETMLYFFYLGNGDHKEAATVDFSNQNGINVTNCHIAIGSEEYTGQISFNAELNMAMAIAYFDLSQFTSDSKTAETVYLSGDHIYSTASVNYNDGTITGNSKGYIKVGTANNGMYVALIPSVTTSTTLNFNSSSKTGSMTFNNGIKPASYYSNSGSALTVSASDGSGIPGTFSVSATKKVFFSKGNLQYTRATTSDDWSTGVWSFMTNQYDVIETENVSDNYAEQTAVSLFGWATSGYNLRNLQSNYYYKPFQTTKSDNYGPEGEYSITGDYALGDWGIYNSSKITNGEGYNTWRVLTFEEWDYVFNTRNASTINKVNDARYAKAKVGDVFGIILFPDNYSHPNNVALPVGINDKYGNHWTNSTSTNNNIYSTSDWENMESNGAVFLPASGSRSGATLSYYNASCYYWSSDHYSTKYAYRIYVSATSVTTSGANAYSARSIGMAVRLVRE